MFTNEEKAWAERFIKYNHNNNCEVPGSAPSLNIWCHVIKNEIKKIKSKDKKVN